MVTPPQSGQQLCPATASKWRTAVFQSVYSPCGSGWAGTGQHLTFPLSHQSLFTIKHTPPSFAWVLCWFLISHWKLMQACRSSSLLSNTCTMASRMLVWQEDPSSQDHSWFLIPPHMARWDEHRNGLACPCGWDSGWCPSFPSFPWFYWCVH